MQKRHRILAYAGAAALLGSFAATVACAGPTTQPAVAAAVIVPATQPAAIVPATQPAVTTPPTTQPVVGAAATQPVGGAAATQPTDPKAVADARHKNFDPRWRQMNENQRNSQKTHWASAPIAQTFKPGALVNLSLANGLLKVDTTDLATVVPVRVAVEGIKAVWMLGRPRPALIGGAFGALAGGGNYISLTRFDFDAKDDEPWHSSLFINDRNLNLGTQSIYGNTSFVQANGLISVRVAEFAQLGQPQRVICTMQATSIVQLRAEHPEEFRLYVLPLLAQFSDPSFLQPGAGDVYGAFLEIPADQKVTAEVEQLIPQLDADDPVDRDAASGKLRQLGAPGVLATLRVDESSLSEEQKLRLKSFVAGSRRFPVADPTSQRHNVSFLIDCLEYEDVAVRIAAKADLENQTHQTIDFDPALTGSAAAAAADALRKQLLAPPVAPPATPATRPSPQV